MREAIERFSKVWDIPKATLLGELVHTLWATPSRLKWFCSTPILRKALMKANHAIDSELLRDCIEDHVRVGFASLLRAYIYAKHVEADIWDIAVPISELSSLGMMQSDFYWLVAGQFAEHRLETTPRGADKRSFKSKGRVEFSEQTCFTLTKHGAEFATELLGLSPIDILEFTSKSNHSACSTDSPQEVRDVLTHSSVPTWDSSRRELRVGRLTVKRFRVKAGNQERILAAFQEDRWPEHIDDPLSPCPDIAPKRRLHDAINSLNRNQQKQLIRFFGNGNGDGVCWELVNPID